MRSEFSAQPEEPQNVSNRSGSISRSSVNQFVEVNLRMNMLTGDIFTKKGSNASEMESKRGNNDSSISSSQQQIINITDVSKIEVNKFDDSKPEVSKVEPSRSKSSASSRLASMASEGEQQSD